MAISFALPAYLARLGLSAAPRTDVEGLATIHRAHVSTIPFENLDVQMGHPIRLDLASVQRKLIAAKRGGYCFEHNTLLSTALLAMGFDVRAYEARVSVNSDGVPPRNHMLLGVRVGEREWLCDAGFGAHGPLEPVCIGGGTSVQALDAYRVQRRTEEYTLQWQRGTEWEDLYVFEPIPRHPIDFELANWFTCTHPESRFVRTLTAQRVTPFARWALRNLDLTFVRGACVDVRRIGRDELTRVLDEIFDIEVPATARFRAIDGNGADQPVDPA